MIDDFLAHAGRLAVASPAKPRQVDLKRSISASYYSVFHALAKNAADCLVGSVKRDRPNKAWTQVYRALDHGSAKSACEKVRNMPFPQHIKDCADIFVELQSRRHAADYDPNVRLARSEALDAVAKAAVAVQSLKDATLKDRRAFAVQVLFKTR